VTESLDGSNSSLHGLPPCIFAGSLESLGAESDQYLLAKGGFEVDVTTVTGR
jgi:hypothetical protein